MSKPSKHWSRKEKVDKIIHDELPTRTSKKSVPKKLPTCYEFERQFIENLTETDGQIVLKYGMVCTSHPEAVVKRASHFPRIFKQYGGTGNPEILANLLNEAVQNIPDFKGTFVQGVGISKRQEKSIKDYIEPVKVRLEQIKKLLEIIPDENKILLPIKEIKYDENTILMVGSTVSEIQEFVTVLDTTKNKLQQLMSDPLNETFNKEAIEQLKLFIQNVLKYIDSKPDNPNTLVDSIQDQIKSQNTLFDKYIKTVIENITLQLEQLEQLEQPEQLEQSQSNKEKMEKLKKILNNITEKGPNRLSALLEFQKIIK